MPERNQPTSPEVAAALRAYEVEMRDGTERGQRAAYEALRTAQRRTVGGAAIQAAATELTPQHLAEDSE